MMFLRTIEHMRAWPEEKRQGAVFLIAGIATVAIFLIWLSVAIYTRSQSAAVAKSQDPFESTKNSGPSSYDALVESLKAQQNAMVERTQQVEPSFLGAAKENDTLGTNAGREEGGMTEAEKRAFLDKYFGE